MAKLHYFKWCPKDCDTDENVRSMDDREFGFYMRCLNHSWLNDGLPADLGEIARVIGRTRKYVESVWPRVGRCFTVSLSENRIGNSKQESERSHARLKSERNTNAVRSRYERSGNVVPRAYGSGSVSGSVAQRGSAEGGVSLNGFDSAELWDRAMSEYPGEVKPDWDCRFWVSEILDAERSSLFFARLNDWKQSRKWRDGFVPSLENYLRKGQWKTSPPPEPETQQQTRKSWAQEQFDRA